MNIVLDASAVLAVLLGERSKPAIIAATAGEQVYGCETLPFEIANALSARARRRPDDADRITTEQLVEAVEIFQGMDIPLVRMGRREHLEAAKLAGELGIYAYDAYLLVTCLAFSLSRQKPKLLTLDGSGKRCGLAAVAREVGIELVEV